MPAHWCVELGFGPLVGRVVSRDMSRIICGLMKSLGSLSADGWAVFLLYWFFGLWHPSAGTYRLLGWARS